MIKEEIAELYGAINALSNAMDYLHQQRMEKTKQMFALNQTLKEQALDKKAENARELGLDYAPTWAGLTDEEMMDAIYVDDTPMERGRRVEAKLKDKNNG
jgi:hypothetical protein